MYVGLDFNSTLLDGAVGSQQKADEIVKQLEEGLKNCINHRWGDYELTVSASDQIDSDGHNLYVYLYGVSSEVNTIKSRDFLASYLLPDVINQNSISYQEFDESGECGCESDCDCIEGVWLDADFIDA